ncbi:TniQ family protein [Pseudomonas silvicola]|nr:TniQ family protein [Pseudomonas silvicola]
MLNLAVMVYPHHDESFVGYMGRLAKANALPHTYFQQKFLLLSEEEQSGFLSKVNAPMGWVDTIRAIIKPRSNHDPMCYRSPKHCPQCMLEFGYWKHIWMFKLYNVCTSHGVQLVERCSHCQMLLCYDAFSNLRCSHCGNSFLHPSNFKKAGAIDCWFSRLIENRISNSDPLNPTLICNLSFEDFHSAFFNLGRVVMTETSGKRIVGVVRSTEDMTAISHACATIAFDWPWSFLEYLRKVHLKQGGRWTATGCFDRVRHVLYHALKDHKFDFLRAEFEHYLTENWKGPIDSKAKTLSSETVENHSWKPIAVAAKMLGIKNSRVKVFIRQGRLASNSIRYECGKVSTIINVEELRAIAAEQARVQTLTQVARRLGVNERRVRELIEAELLPVLTKKCRGENSWWLDCDSFVGKLEPLKLDSSEGNPLPISHFVKYYLKKERSFVGLVRSILDGHLKVYSAPGAKRFSDLMIRESEYRIFLKSNFGNSIKELCTQQEAAVLLGIPGRYLPFLIKTGVIETTLDGLKRPRLTMKGVRCFHRSYISTIELSKVSGSKVDDLLAKLTDYGLEHDLLVKRPTGLTLEFWKRGPDLQDFIDSNYGGERTIKASEF